VVGFTSFALGVCNGLRLKHKLLQNGPLKMETVLVSTLIACWSEKACN
jgi:hypothetical protein